MKIGLQTLYRPQTLKYVKQKLFEVQGEVDRKAVLVGEFTTVSLL